MEAWGADWGSGFGAYSAQREWELNDAGTRQRPRAPSHPACNPPNMAPACGVAYRRLLLMQCCLNEPRPEVVWQSVTKVVTCMAYTTKCVTYEALPLSP